MADPFAGIPVRLLTAHHLPESLGCDPFDLHDGEVVVNAKGEVRVLVQSYGAKPIIPGVFERLLRFWWLDPATGALTDEDVEAWHAWAGPQVWLLHNPDGKGWRARAPFGAEPEEL